MGFLSFFPCKKLHQSEMILNLESVIFLLFKKLLTLLNTILILTICLCITYNRKFLLECMNKADIHYNGELHKKDFLELYVEIVGGSEKGGREVKDVNFINLH